MTPTRDSALALQRHYLGALSTPARTWLEPLPAACLAFAGSAIRRQSEGCSLDFGTVDAALGECRTVRLFRPGGRPAAIRISDTPPWLRAEWIEGETGALAVEVSEDCEGERSDKITFWVRDELGARLESLRVHITARPRHPLADIAFNGSALPLPFEFATAGIYTISVANRTSVPLTVTFADLPDWMEFQVDGCSRRGPVAGVFFERIAPFSVTLRPRFLGRHQGLLRMRTNDPRPELRDVELRFFSSVAPQRPHVRALAPPPLVAPAAKALTTHVQLENWGLSPAHVTCLTGAPSLTAGQIVPIPPLRNGQPGMAALPIRIASSQLAAGTHRLVVDLHIEEGEPSSCSVPLQVVVPASSPQRRREIRPEMIAALLALLFLTIVLLVAAQEWS